MMTQSPLSPHLAARLWWWRVATGAVLVLWFALVWLAWSEEHPLRPYVVSFGLAAVPVLGGIMWRLQREIEALRAQLKE